MVGVLSNSLQVNFSNLKLFITILISPAKGIYISNSLSSQEHTAATKTFLNVPVSAQKVEETMLRQRTSRAFSK